MAIVDYTLHGESLSKWDDWLADTKEAEWLLPAGITANKIAVNVSLPLWMSATVIRIPLSILSIVTFGVPFWPLHWLLVRPLVFLVVTTSQLWTAVPAARPLLLVFGPLLTAICMTIVSLIPDGNRDHLSARLVLAELWPLSSRRLEWIAEHGTGVAARVNR